MILLKQLLIFLKLKYQETIGKYPKQVIVFSIGFIFTFILCRTIPKTPILVIDIIFSCLVGIATFLSYNEFKIYFNEFEDWIKSNWKEAGKLARKDKR